MTWAEVTRSPLADVPFRKGVAGGANAPAGKSLRGAAPGGLGGRGSGVAVSWGSGAGGRALPPSLAAVRAVGTGQDRAAFAGGVLGSAASFGLAGRCSAACR